MRSMTKKPADSESYALSGQQRWPASATLEFEFTLRYQLDEADGLADLVMERLEPTGICDAIAGASLNGHLELQFVRCARSAEEALGGAMAAVKMAFPSARLVKIVPAPDTPR